MIERSGTVFMFKIIDEHNEIHIKDLEREIKKGYLNQEFVQSRLYEQISANNILCNNDELCELTQKEIFLLKFINFMLV